MHTISDIKNLIKSDSYSFLRTDPHLTDNLILLTVGGSYAYGTNTDQSDLDIRGCAVNSAKRILLNRDFGSFANPITDTVIYSFDKLVSLLTNMNPNTVEILGCKPEHYLLVSHEGQMLLNNKHLFFSQKCIKSFGGYAKNAENKISSVKENKRTKHMMHLVRLYLMCCDILEKEEIITYRENEHDLLMNIRDGKFLTENRVPTPEFFEYLDELKQRFNYAKRNTSLPEKPDYDKIDELRIEINTNIVTDSNHNHYRIEKNRKTLYY